MSILRTLNTAASGMAAHGEALGVVGDNIANANTVGYKRSRGEFQDVLGMASGGKEGPGSGSRLAHIEQMWSQGALLTTESPTDLALSGEGFFVVKGNVGGANANYYTRAGQFRIDKDGFLANPDGLKLQGYTADAQGNLDGAVGDLVISNQALPATATTRADMALNLDANAVLPALPWDPNDPGATSNFSTGMTVYDSLGNNHELTVYFRKSGSNAWEWHAMADGAEMSGGASGTPVEGANGTLTFTTNGALDTETLNASSWDFADATPGQTIAFDFGKAITGDGGDGMDGAKQLGASSSMNGIKQDGFAAGSVSGISIGADGSVMGVFSNGQRRMLGQLAVADFGSNDGLARMGQGLWAETKDSGDALVGTAQSGGRGSIVAGALEQSNVDIGREFVDLIAYQRGFQANSKIIQTADEMYGELVNLRR